MNRVVLSLGSNLGNRLQNIEDALKLLEINAGIILLRSSLYETQPWGLKNQPDFLNMVVLMNTFLNPAELLGRIKEIETALFREKNEKWGSRTIDIDILFFNHEIILTENLVIPHPELCNRKFVLVPLMEILPDFVHPVLKKNIQTILKQCTDSSGVVLSEPEIIKN